MEQSTNTPPPPEQVGEPKPEQIRHFLAAFKHAPRKRPGPKDEPRKGAVIEFAWKAMGAGEWGNVRLAFEANSADAANVREMIARETLSHPEGRAALCKDLRLAADVLSVAPAALIEKSGILAELGPQKGRVAGLAADRIASQQLQDPAPPYDSTRMGLLLANVSRDDLNDPNNGLGPRLCALEWKHGNYDALCNLIEGGVDTSRSVRAGVGEAGTYSDFVTPLQHTIQRFLPHIYTLEHGDTSGWTEKDFKLVSGVAKVFEALRKTNTAVTLTKWEDVKNSELVREFEDNPGTIWGFKKIRGPYVTAAHVPDKGIRPVRRMEIWDAVEQVAKGDLFTRFVSDPANMTNQIVGEAMTRLMTLYDTDDRFADVRYCLAGQKDPEGTKKTFMAQYEAAIRVYFQELAGQLPKLSSIQPSRDMGGWMVPTITDDDRRISIADQAGVHQSKLMGTVLCKTGLYAAKAQGDTVYYCLDGINLDDVVNYKKVKNLAISQFLAEGGVAYSDNPHRPVVTLLEVREIIKNWKDLEETVKFCLNGEIYTGEKLNKLVTALHQGMERAKSEAGRTPAPPRVQFTHELAAIDPTLLQRMDEWAQSQIKRGAPERDVQAWIDMDACDIVRKANYIHKAGTMRQGVLLEYISKKCDLLFGYGVLSEGLVAKARDVLNLAYGTMPADPDQVMPATKAVWDEIKKCAPSFHETLKHAFVTRPQNSLWTK
jgi:hypothetical protein